VPKRERGIYPVAKDVWRVVVPAGVDVARTAKAGRPVYRSVERRFRGTLTEARAFRARLIVETGQGRYGGTDATVDVLLDENHRELERLGRAPGTLKDYDDKARTYIRPFLGPVKVRDLNSRRLTVWLTSLTDQGLKPNTVRIAHAVLSSALERAVVWEWIEKNPLRLVKPPGLPNKRPVIPTVEDVVRLIEAAEASKTPEMARAIWLSATTGIRRGEMCALRLTDFDLERGRMTVHHAISAGQVWTTKNRQWREVALDDLTVAVVKAQELHLWDRAARAGTSLKPDAYLFTDRPDGSVPWRPDRVTLYFRRLAKTLHLEHLTFHKLRKFMESRALDAGYSIAEVAHRAGHDPAVLLRFYAGGVDESGKALSASVASLLAPGR
jgi:integrase